MIDQLLDRGYVIVPGLLSDEALFDLRTQIQPHLLATPIDGGNAFMGAATKRFGRLLERVVASRTLVQHPVVLRAVDAVLRPIAPTYQIHFTGVMHLGEGQTAQVLHRDTTPFANPGPTVVVAAMWAISDFIAENGATVLVPGSHLWPEARVPKQSELVTATMPAGSLLFYLGNLIHGAGACVRGSRTGLNMQYSVSWLRQEENQYLAVVPHTAKGFDPALQRLMGYDLAAHHWGYVDQTHPLNFLNGEHVVGGLAPDGYEFKGRVHTIHAQVGGLHTHDFYQALPDEVNDDQG